MSSDRRPSSSKICYLGFYCIHLPHVLSEETKKYLMEGIHQSIGASLEEINGYEGAKELPIPAMYVIYREKKIIYSYVNPMWSERAEPIDFIAATKNP
jgi:hypothetical protein